MDKNFYESIQQRVSTALAEDIGSGDLTAALIPADRVGEAHVVTRESAILCGVFWFDEVYQQLDDSIEVQWHFKDGDSIHPNEHLCTITGSLRHILSGERTALNFLQTLSATATAADKYASAVQDFAVKILDTRKTLPGLRQAQKYAVKCGGCFNHRMGLYDAILIKENHIISAGSITTAIHNARMLWPALAIEVEVETLAQLEEALVAKADRLLLDNMPLTQLQQAVAITAGKAQLEASGGINLNNIRQIAATGVDYISVGEITKNVNAIDLSMRFDNSPQQ